MKKILVSSLIILLSGMTVAPAPVMAESVYRHASLDRTASMDDPVNVPGGERMISLSVADQSIQSVLRGLAAQGGFNMLVDDSVSGNVTLDLSNISLNQALQSVATMGNLLIVKQPGNIYLAIARNAAEDKGIARQLSKVIKIYYSNANRIASILNRSLFAEESGSSSSSNGQNEKAKADPRTNSLIVVGTAREIELAEAAVAKLDVPRQSKTFYLSHANALDVAAMLSSSIFNDGTASLSLSGGGGGGGASAGGAGGGNGGMQVTPSPLRVEQQEIEEGTGINNFGSSGGSGSLTSGLSSSVTLRGFVKSSGTVQVSPEGALVIPDTRQNAVTIMGTAEQIELAESLIPTLDARLPQVAIEASLIEISSTGRKELGTRFGIADGRMHAGFNNTGLEGITPTTGLPAAVQPTGTGLIGMPTVDPNDNASLAQSGIVLSTNPLAKNKDYLMQLRHLITRNKAKILANPTIVATHDTESIISIVDEVVRRVTTQADPSGFATQTIEIGEAGIVLDILPRIGEDGTINMRLRPSVTSPSGPPFRVMGNLVTLLTKKDFLTQNVRVRDGETLVIGGLIEERETSRQERLPLAGDLPIVGAMFRASQKTSERSELVLLITPHIINPTRSTPIQTTSVGIPVQTSMAGGEQ